MEMKHVTNYDPVFSSSASQLNVPKWAGKYTTEVNFSKGFYSLKCSSEGLRDSEGFVKDLFSVFTKMIFFTSDIDLISR